MAWNTPVTSNTPETKVTVTTFDEIAENQVYLKERADVVDSDLGQAVNTGSDVSFNKITTPTGDITTVNSTTGNITTINSTTINNSGAVNCATINTGQGAVEAYAMNQPTRTTDNVTFNNGTFDGNSNPTTSPQNGTWTSSQLIPRGQYNVSFNQSGTSQYCQIYEGDPLHTIISSLTLTPLASGGGCFFSNGVSTYISCVGGATAEYWKY